MAHPALQIPHVTTARELQRSQSGGGEEIRWCCEELAGRLVELCNTGSSATLTFAMSLVLEAQRARAPVAWISANSSIFYPPDVARNGIDLDALPVILLRGAQSAARATDKLLRSDAFWLIILDLGVEAWLPPPLQNRLVRLAERHGTAVVCLTEKSRNGRPLGPPVSLRAEATRTRIGPGHFRCELKAVKDKRRGPNWSQEKVCDGTIGLR